jgi:CheY-like chemotaxis protein
MPALDGYETATRIAQRPWAADTQLIAVSGWPQEAVQNRVKEAGFHRQLVKPVEAQALRQQLEELTD